MSSDSDTSSDNAGSQDQKPLVLVLGDHTRDLFIYDLCPPKHKAPRAEWTPPLSQHGWQFAQGFEKRTCVGAAAAVHAMLKANGGCEVNGNAFRFNPDPPGGVSWSSTSDRTSPTTSAREVGSTSACGLRATGQVSRRTLSNAPTLGVCAIVTSRARKSFMSREAYMIARTTQPTYIMSACTTCVGDQIAVRPTYLARRETRCPIGQKRA